MKLDFDDTRRITRGKPIKVRLRHGSGALRQGEFMTVIPGKPGASGRDRQDAIVMRDGDLISYFRRGDVCDITVDARHVTKEVSA